MVKIKKNKKSCTVHLQGDMTIYTASELKEKLLPVIADERELEINLSDISEIDSAGVQLLMLAQKERLAKNLVLNLEEHSDAVVEMFELLDLVSYFNDPVILAGDKGEKHGA